MNDPINQTLKSLFSFLVKYLGAFPACPVTNLSKRKVTFQCDFAGQCLTLQNVLRQIQGGQQEFQRKEKEKEALVATLII